MACNITVTSVTGVMDDQGQLTSIKIEGKVQDCRRVGIETGCGHLHTLEEDVKQDGTFEKVFTGNDLSQTECSCEAQIRVRVFCLADTHCQAPLWKGKLKCEHDQAPGGGGSQGPGAKRCEEKSDLIRECTAPDTAKGPQYVIPFHQLVGVLKLNTPFKVGQINGNEVPKLAAAIPQSGSELGVQLGAHLQYEQRWFFKGLYISDIVSSVALAPMEELSLRFRRTQRKRLTQKTIDNVEEIQSTESSLLDKDALNVTRSSSQTEGWNIASNASVGLIAKPFTLGLGVSPSYSNTITDAAQSSVEHVNETTQKSARTLKTLHQTEIEEVYEITTEASSQRKIRNPYRDRSLLLKVFQLEKHFCVETILASVKPVLMIIVNEIDFNRDFILASHNFLEQMMIDRDLAFQLTGALENALENRTDENLGQSKERAIRIASLALAYLFEIKNIFELPGYEDKPHAEWPMEVANDPAESFIAHHSFSAGGTDARSALSEALNTDFGFLFTALNMYYAIYQKKIVDQRKKSAPASTPGEPVPPDDLLDELLPVELAVSLERYITPLWSGKEQVVSNQVSAILDENNRTEVFRRLSGFQSLVQGVLRPMLEPLKEEKERLETAKRAELVLTRVEGHLRAHATYYTTKYLEYLSQQVGLDLVRTFAERTLNYWSTDQNQRGHHWLTDQNQRDLAHKLFDPAKAFVDRNVIAVPLRDGVEHTKVKEFDPNRIFARENFTDKELGVGYIKHVPPEDVEVPFDGIHIEAVPGGCPKLPDLPAESAEEAEISMKARSW